MAKLILKVYLITQETRNKRTSHKNKLKGYKRKGEKYYINAMFETKDARVRVTYLAAALKVNWTLSGGPGFSWI